jgi:hypothetical protein
MKLRTSVVSIVFALFSVAKARHHSVAAMLLQGSLWSQGRLAQPKRT